MTKLATRKDRLSGFLAFEAFPEEGVCREPATVVWEAGMGVGSVVTSNGAGKYVWVTAASVATLNADVAMVVSSDKEMASLTAGDQTVTLLIRGQAKVIGNKLVFKDTLSAPQRATVLAAFKAKSILNSTAI